MDVPDYPVTVDEEADAGPIPLAGVQPPLLEGAPIRVDGNREFEAETLRILFHVLDAQLLVRLVMIKSDHFQAAPVIIAIKFIQGRRGGPAIGTVRRRPPPDQDDLPPQLRKLQRLGVEPVFDLPIGRFGSNRYFPRVRRQKDRAKKRRGPKKSARSGEGVAPAERRGSGPPANQVAESKEGLQRLKARPNSPKALPEEGQRELRVRERHSPWL